MVSFFGEAGTDAAAGNYEKRNSRDDTGCDTDYRCPI